MDLKLATAEFEKHFTVVEGEATAISQTGEAYLTVMSGGIHREGTLMPALYAAANDAVAAWLRSALVYGELRGQYLYWRKRPEMQPNSVTFAGGHTVELYSVYSRMLVTNKAPPVSASWRKYRSHKIVEAAVIHGFDIRAHVVGFCDGAIGVSADFFSRGNPSIGDYLVRYADGYLSWSPKKAFEEGNTPVEEYVVNRVG